MAALSSLFYLLSVSISFPHVSTALRELSSGEILALWTGMIEIVEGIDGDRGDRDRRDRVGKDRDELCAMIARVVNRIVKSGSDRGVVYTLTQNIVDRILANKVEVKEMVDLLKERVDLNRNTHNVDIERIRILQMGIDTAISRYLNREARMKDEKIENINEMIEYPDRVGKIEVKILENQKKKKIEGYSEDACIDMCLGIFKQMGEVVEKIIPKDQRYRFVKSLIPSSLLKSSYSNPLTPTHPLAVSCTHPSPSTLIFTLLYKTTPSAYSLQSIQASIHPSSIDQYTYTPHAPIAMPILDGLCVQTVLGGYSGGMMIVARGIMNCGIGYVMNIGGVGNGDKECKVDIVAYVMDNVESTPIHPILHAYSSLTHPYLLTLSPSTPTLYLLPSTPSIPIHTLPVSPPLPLPSQYTIISTIPLYSSIIHPHSLEGISTLISTVDTSIVKCNDNGNTQALTAINIHSIGSRGYRLIFHRSMPTPLSTLPTTIMHMHAQEGNYPGGIERIINIVSTREDIRIIIRVDNINIHDLF